MELSGRAIDIVVRLLEQRTGQKFGANRRWRISSALAGVMRARGIASGETLILRLMHDAGLARDVVDALLNNETYFFRDRALFDHIATRILPALAERRKSTRRLSVWAAGCSTGQEVLSLAMLFAERKAHWAGWTIDLLGTDVSATAIEAARKGAYSQFEIQRGLGVGQMLAFFEERSGGWQAVESLLRMARFEVHNLLDTPPGPGNFDLVLCRNVLLYFDSETRGRAFANLARALASDGHLLLGGGETAVGQTGLLEPDHAHPGFCRHKAMGAGPGVSIVGCVPPWPVRSGSR
ncbi:MAG: protein-glutamate O-methyltransferase CheR [Novosphingobium sp.]|nr:protein-glutamate O-methyltransferase CheR [Novosphingobium sp.]